MAVLNAVVKGAEMTPIQIRQMKELKLKSAAAYDKVDEAKAVDPNATKILKGQFQGRAAHWSIADEPFHQFDVYRSRGDAFENVGVHAGTSKAAAERFAMYGRGDSEQVISAVDNMRTENAGARKVHPQFSQGHVVDLAFREDKPFLDPKGRVYEEDEVRKALLNEIRTPEFFQYIKDKGYWKEIAGSEKIRLEREKKRAESLLSTSEYPAEKQLQKEKLDRINAKLKNIDEMAALSSKETSEFTGEEAKRLSSLIYNEYGPLVGEYLSEHKGYTHIPYKNYVEDKGSTSYIILNPYKNARRVDAAFMSEYGGLKAGVAGAAGAAGIASQADKSDNKTTVKVKLKSKGTPSGT